MDPSKATPRILTAGVIALTTGLLIILVILPSVGLAKERIMWTPTSLNGEVARGFSKTVSVSFTPAETINNVTVLVAPELEPFVKVNPSTFRRIHRGQTITLNATFSASNNSALGTFLGTIQIEKEKKKDKDDDADKGKDKPNDKEREKNEKENLLVPPLPVQVLVTVVPLPPDPAQAGKATLAGIDADGDGVRDDIERYIALTYPDSAKSRTALTQYALAAQAALLNANGAQATITYTESVFRGMECLYYIRATDAGDIIDRLSAQVLNTEIRTRAWIAGEQHLGGQVFRSVRDRKSACGFNPDALQN